MSAAQTSPIAPAVCPRCRSATIELRSTSPVAGVWTVFGCTTCLYAWRSTEPEENRDPDKYPAVFRLDPGKLADLAVIPSIPPLRTPRGGSSGGGSG
jgi:vanillate/4-hydroxybenzoate decarboxylase subunit D